MAGINEVPGQQPTFSDLFKGKMREAGLVDDEGGLDVKALRAKISENTGETFSMWALDNFVQGRRANPSETVIKLMAAGVEDPDADPVKTWQDETELLNAGGYQRTGRFPGTREFDPTELEID